MWMDVKYEPGTVKVVAFGKDGKPVAEKVMVTAGKPYKLVLEPDRKIINADGNDISFVTVSVVDKDGNVCPAAAEQLTFSVKGNGVYRAACNGDATSLEMFHLPTMKTFSGKLVVLVQAGNEAGNIELTVSGKNVRGGKVVLEAKK
jgi:beta-galactosidase